MCLHLPLSASAFLSEVTFQTGLHPPLSLLQEKWGTPAPVPAPLHIPVPPPASYSHVFLGKNASFDHIHSPGILKVKSKMISGEEEDTLLL